MRDKIYQNGSRSSYYIDGEVFSSYRDAFSYLHIVIGLDIDECHQYLGLVPTIRS